jgi:hypothetical protein
MNVPGRLAAFALLFGLGLGVASLLIYLIAVALV